MYSWVVNSTHVCDAMMHLLHNPLRYVNSISKAESCGAQNVEIRETVFPAQSDHLAFHGEAQIPVYVATRNIEVGEELLVDYGGNYFRMRNPRFATYECHTHPLAVAATRGDERAVVRLPALPASYTQYTYGVSYRQGRRVARRTGCCKQRRACHGH